MICFTQLHIIDNLKSPVRNIGGLAVKCFKRVMCNSLYDWRVVCSRKQLYLGNSIHKWGFFSNGIFLLENVLYFIIEVPSPSLHMTHIYIEKTANQRLDWRQVNVWVALSAAHLVYPELYRQQLRKQ